MEMRLAPGAGGNGDSTTVSASSDGRYVAFTSAASNLVNADTNSAADVFVRDRQTGQTTRVSVSSAGVQGNGDSTAAALSADGRYVVFQSAASNLVASDTNAALDIFVHDRQTGTTTRVSVDSSGTQGNGDSSVASISAERRPPIRRPRPPGSRAAEERARCAPALVPLRLRHALAAMDPSPSKGPCRYGHGHSPRSRLIR